MKDHLDGVGPGPVSCAHVAVALGDGRAHGQVPVLAVHVVGSRPGKSFVIGYFKSSRNVTWNHNEARLRSS